MVQIILRTIALTAVLASGFSASMAQADFCQDFFDTLLQPGLKENEFGTLTYNTGSGRNHLTTSHLLGSMTQTTSKGTETFLTVSMGRGGVRDFLSTLVFEGIEPVRARAIVTDPGDSGKLEETRIVTLIGMRTNPNPKADGAPQYIARKLDGKLVLVLSIIPE